MPLGVTQTSAGSMPDGGGLMTGGGSGSGDGTDAVNASAITPDGTQPTAGQGATGWMPVFQIGSGQNGVPTTARGLISGFQASSSIAANTSNAANSALQAGLAANTPTTSGSATGSTGPAGGAADSTASGDQGNPDDRGAGNGPVNPPSGSPAPKATSQAQRDANNAEAQREFPGYVGAG